MSRVAELIPCHRLMTPGSRAGGNSGNIDSTETETEDKRGDELETITDQEREIIT